LVATQPRLKSDRSQRKLEEITAYLEQDIASLEEQMRQGHTEAFLEAMDFWSKFYQYAYISHRLGYQYHSAEMRSVDEARKVYRIASELKG